MKKMFVSLFVAVAVTGLAACGGGSSAGSSQSEASTEKGAAAYQNSCASCHGVDLRGTGKGPSQLSVVYEPNHHGDDAYRSAIANGAPQHHWEFGDMPPVQDITAAETEDVIAYIRSEQERLGFEN